MKRNESMQYSHQLNLINLESSYNLGRKSVSFSFSINTSFTNLKKKVDKIQGKHYGSFKSLNALFKQELFHF